MCVFFLLGIPTKTLNFVKYNSFFDLSISSKKKYHLNYKYVKCQFIEIQLYSLIFISQFKGQIFDGLQLYLTFNEIKFIFKNCYRTVIFPVKVFVLANAEQTIKTNCCTLNIKIIIAVIYRKISHFFNISFS